MSEIRRRSERWVRATRTRAGALVREGAGFVGDAFNTMKRHWWLLVVLYAIEVWTIGATG